MRGCVDTVLETVLGVIDAPFSPLVSERASNVVNVPGCSACGGGGKQGVKDHDCAAMDEETDLAAKQLECALLEVIEEIEEHRACELDIIVRLHRVEQRGQGRARVTTICTTWTSCSELLYKWTAIPVPTLLLYYYLGTGTRT